MASVHGLQHVERFAATALTNHDAVGTHTQGVDQQVANRDATLALDIGRPRFESHDVRLTQLKFGCIFDRDDALVLRDEA